MEDRRPDLLDDALGAAGKGNGGWLLNKKVVVVLDQIETNGSFVLHQIIKRALLSSNGCAIFLAFSHPFTHYDRILRKLGCNLTAYTNSKRFIFFDLLNSNFSDKFGGGLSALYGKVQNAVKLFRETFDENVTIVIDDMSLLEVAANGSLDSVLNFLHYCYTLTVDIGCTLLILVHEDIYDTIERPPLLLQLNYLADILIKVEPLATGLATDVHGQLTIVKREATSSNGTIETKVSNFQFKMRENNVEYFYPGGRT